MISSLYCDLPRQIYYIFGLKKLAFVKRVSLVQINGTAYQTHYWSIKLMVNEMIPIFIVAKKIGRVCTTIFLQM